MLLEFVTPWYHRCIEIKTTAKSPPLRAQALGVLSSALHQLEGFRSIGFFSESSRLVPAIAQAYFSTSSVEA